MNIINEILNVAIDIMSDLGYQIAVALPVIYCYIISKKEKSTK